MYENFRVLLHLPTTAPAVPADYAVDTGPQPVGLPHGPVAASPRPEKPGNSA